MTTTTAENRPGTVRLGLLPGDGIGPEVVASAVAVLERLAETSRPTAQKPTTEKGFDLETVTLDAGWRTFESTGTALPDATVESLRSCDGALFGAVGSPSERVEGYKSPIVALRRQFDLYANLRPLSGNGIDMLIVRENTEGLYAGREHKPDPDTAITERVITRQASTRIVRCAFEQALERAESPDAPARRGSPSCTKRTWCEPETACFEKLPSMLPMSSLRNIPESKSRNSWSTRWPTG